MATVNELDTLLACMAAEENGTDEVDVRHALQVVRAWAVDERRLRLSRFVREQFLSEEALASGYGIEDAVIFGRWLDDHFAL